MERKIIRFAPFLPMFLVDAENHMLYNENIYVKVRQYINDKEYDRFRAI